MLLIELKLQNLSYVSSLMDYLDIASGLRAPACIDKKNSGVRLYSGCHVLVLIMR